MINSEEQIGQILNSDEAFRKLKDLLAPLEIDRLAELISSVLQEAEADKKVPAKQLLEDALSRDKKIFGNLNLSNMMDIDGLLKQL